MNKSLQFSLSIRFIIACRLLDHIDKNTDNDYQGMIQYVEEKGQEARGKTQEVNRAEREGRHGGEKGMRKGRRLVDNTAGYKSKGEEPNKVHIES